MKKIAVGFICLGFLFCASSCWAAYVILLKDGRSITTHEYWEEGDQIKIKQYGGVVGINKDNVLSIEDADVKTIVVKSPPETEPEKADEKAESPQEEKEARKEKPEKPAKEKNPIIKEFNSLKKRFEKVEFMSKQELSEFDKSLRELRNNLIKAGLAGPYANQMVEILDMGNRAEEIYKRKAQ